MKRGEYIDWLKIYQSKLHLTKKGNNYVALCPYHNDRNPSFSIMSNGNFKCFSCGEGGSVYKFIKDFELKEIKSTNLLNIQSNFTQKETIIEFSDQKFQKIHSLYWDKYQLPEDYLRNKDTYAVKAWAINSKLQKIPEGRAVFAFYDSKIDKCKILQIGEGVKKSEKWRNNAPNSHLWYLPENKCNQLWIIKSIKDYLCLNYHFGVCGTSVQNEDYKILEPNMPKLQAISNDLVLCYGADEMAVRNCKIIQQKYKTKYFNTPRYMLKYGVIDIADCIDQFGVEIVKNELKKKGYGKI